jgi:streptomycin 3"-adenylyltransferase
VIPPRKPGEADAADAHASATAASARSLIATEYRSRLYEDRERFVKLPRVAEQLQEAVAFVQGVLGDGLLGLYLYGSAVHGGLKRTSDLDLMAVVRRPTTDRERHRLVEGLLERDHKPRYLELTVVVESDVRPWRYPPVMDLQYGAWLRAEFERGEIPPPAPNPDLAPLLTMTLQHGTPLVGPPPGEVLDPVPHEDLLRSGTDELDGILAGLDDDTRNLLLTLTRIWSTAETGVMRPKDAAADWALPRLPPDHRRVFERARDGYREGDYGTWDDVDVHAAADHVAAEIRRPRPRRGGGGPR